MSYKLRISELFFEKLEKMYDFYSIEKDNIILAEKKYTAITKQISKLSEDPDLIRIIPQEPFHSKGLRRVSVEYYSIIFTVDEDAETVDILDLFYAGSDYFEHLRS